MPAILHIVTKPGDDLAREIVRQQRTDPKNQLEVTDLTQPSPDYRALLEKVFASDSVQVW